MDALVKGLALVLVLCPTLNTGVVTAHSGPEACADPDVQTLIDVQNSCTSANSSCNIMIPETCQLNITCTVLGVTEAVDSGGGDGGVGSLMENATRAVDCPFDTEAAVRELKDEGYTTR